MRFKVAHSYVILPLALVTAVFAQGPHSGANLPGVNASAAQATPSALAFSRPQIVAELNAHPSIAGRFDCSRAGTVYTFIDGYAPNTGTTPKQRLELLGIHPDGSVTRFPWRSVAGFSDISLPRSVFVRNERVYVLLEGDRAIEGHRSPYFIVLTFNPAGVLLRTTVLEQGIDPLVLGVFASGNIVVISEDRLNRRMALDVFSPTGARIRPLDLGDNDYLEHSPRFNLGNGSKSYNPVLLISMSKFFAFGDHLLLVPLETSALPIVELSEHGVFRAVVPQLPERRVIESVLSSSQSSIEVRLATIVATEHPALDAEDNLLSVGTTASGQLTDLSLEDGKVIRETNIGSTAVQPACDAGGALRLFTSIGSAGKLAVVTATAR